MADLLYHHSQGVADITVKLFALAQARAIHDGSETIDGMLIDSVAKQELGIVMPMIEALRNNDLNALANYRDIAPTQLDSLLSDVSAKYSGRRVSGAMIAGTDPLFAPTVAQALTVVGFDQPLAQTLSEKVTDSANVLEGVKAALKHATSGKPATKRSSAKAKPAPVPEAYPPGDYRNALSPEAPGDSNFKRLKNFKMVADVETLLDL